jgi:hypothetical protein
MGLPNVKVVASTASCQDHVPAGVAFWSFATHTLVAAPTVPEQVMPAGICILTGKSVVVVVEIPAARPGTFCVTSAFLNAATSVPPEVPSPIAVNGPAPSWLIW